MRPVLAVNELGLILRLVRIVIDGDPLSGLSEQPPNRRIAKSTAIACH